MELPHNHVQWHALVLVVLNLWILLSECWLIGKMELEEISWKDWRWMKLTLEHVQW